MKGGWAANQSVLPHPAYWASPNDNDAGIPTIRHIKGRCEGQNNLLPLVAGNLAGRTGFRCLGAEGGFLSRGGHQCDNARPRRETEFNRNSAGG